ncbi:hypothetical protein [Actinoallomurus sp. NPDC050550]|uniref:hypothetical protein n=1 Tax=Actinoallomurus sp. NPDC050550 TaxID=3154937 RepID=UPI0033CE27FF
MKSWRSRIALGLAALGIVAGAAAATVPLAATSAFADTAPNDGWVQVGGDSYDSFQDCVAQAQRDLPLNPQYHEATCQSYPKPGLPNYYLVWMR